MPARYRIDTGRRTLFTESSGVLTEADCVLLWRSIRRDADMQPDFDALEDFRRVSRFEIRPEWLWDFVCSFRRFDDRNAGARAAMVVPTADGLILALVGVHAREASPPTFQVFQEMGSARLWLGLPPETPMDGAVWVVPTDR